MKKTTIFLYDFYRYIADKFVARYKISNWVEIGCGYGHLMEILRVYGYNIKGVEIEISEMLLAHLKQRGFEVYKNINDVNLVEGVILIDSLYYFEKPLELLDSYLIKNCRVLIIRTIHRNPLINIYTRLFPDKTVPKELFGDALFSPSVQGLIKVLQARGFHVSIHTEPATLKTKGAVLRKKLVYYTTSFLTRISGHMLTPGFIVEATREDKEVLIKPTGCKDRF